MHPTLPNAYGTLTPKHLGYDDYSKADRKRNKYIENQMTRDMLFNNERRRQNDTMMAAASVKNNLNN